jgi:hypothetical protein
MPSATNGAGSLPANGLSRKPTITGREMAAWSSGASLVTKLAIGAAWANGEIEVIDPTITQIARVLGVQSKQIRTIATLSPDKRAALTSRPHGPRGDAAGSLSNVMLDDLVKQVGAGRLMDAIDRATRPAAM